MAKSKPAATFEVFQMDTKYWWYIKDADGEIIDAWNSNLHFDKKQDRMVGGRAFNSEADARKWIAENHPTAKDLHVTRDDLPSELAVDKARAEMEDAGNDVDLEALEQVRRDHRRADDAHRAKLQGAR